MDQHDYEVKSRMDILTSRVSELEKKVNIIDKFLGMNEYINYKANTITYKNLELNLNRFNIKKDNEVIKLTNIEFAILKLLFQNQQRTIPRKEFMDNIWNYNDDESRVLDVMIARIRRKIGSEIIKTCIGLGYCLD